MPIEEYWENIPDAGGHLPPCQFYVSVQQPDCGKPAKWGVRVKNKVSDAIVNMCDEHKNEHQRKLEAARRQQYGAGRQRRKSQRQNNGQ